MTQLRCLERELFDEEFRSSIKNYLIETKAEFQPISELD